MDKNYLIQLTQNLYRLTLLFPKKEPLRYKMREIANDILAHFIKYPPLSNSPKITRDPTSGKSKLPEVRPLENLQGSDLWKKALEGMVGDLEVLDGFFEVAKNQNWVAPAELLRIQEEYNRIKTEIKKIAKQPSKEQLSKEGQTPAKLTGVRHPSSAEPSEGWEMRRSLSKSRQILNLRQEKILEILKAKGQVQVWQIKEIFPEVSKRTLRRDFGFLLKQGKIERIGERNETFYRLSIKAQG